MNNNAAAVNALFGELCLCTWFVLVGAAFFAPYLGLSVVDATFAYGVFLLLFAGALTLRLLQVLGAKAPPAGKKKRRG